MNYVTIDKICIEYRRGLWKEDIKAKRKLLAMLQDRIGNYKVYTPQCMFELLTAWYDEVGEDDER